MVETSRMYLLQRCSQSWLVRRQVPAVSRRGPQTEVSATLDGAIGLWALYLYLPGRVCRTPTVSSSGTYQPSLCRMSTPRNQRSRWRTLPFPVGRSRRPRAQPKRPKRTENGSTNQKRGALSGGARPTTRGVGTYVVGRRGSSHPRLADPSSYKPPLSIIFPTRRITNSSDRP